MPANTAMPIACRISAPGAAEQDERHDARDERDRRHQDRPQPQAARVEHRLDARAPPPLSCCRANSTIRIAFLQARPTSTRKLICVKTLLSAARQPARPRSREQSTIGTIRITLSGSVQLSYSAASTRNTSSTHSGKMQSVVLPAMSLLIREIGPLERHAGRQLLGRGLPPMQRLRLARAEARRRRAVDLRRRIAVVVHHLIGPVAAAAR